MYKETNLKRYFVVLRHKNGRMALFYRKGAAKDLTLGILFYGRFC